MTQAEQACRRTGRQSRQPAASKPGDWRHLRPKALSIDASLESSVLTKGNEVAGKLTNSKESLGKAKGSKERQGKAKKSKEKQGKARESKEKQATTSKSKEKQIKTCNLVCAEGPDSVREFVFRVCAPRRIC